MPDRQPGLPTIVGGAPAPQFRGYRRFVSVMLNGWEFPVLAFHDSPSNSHKDPAPSAIAPGAPSPSADVLARPAPAPGEGGLSRGRAGAGALDHPTT